MSYILERIKSLSSDENITDYNDLINNMNKINELVNQELNKIEIEKSQNFYCHDECVSNACEDFDFVKCSVQCDKCKNN